MPHDAFLLKFAAYLSNELDDAHQRSALWEHIGLCRHCRSDIFEALAAPASTYIDVGWVLPIPCLSDALFIRSCLGTLPPDLCASVNAHITLCDRCKRRYYSELALSTRHLVAV